MDTLKLFLVLLLQNFITTLIQTIILYMILPRKINYTQMGWYPDVLRKYTSEQNFYQRTLWHSGRSRLADMMNF